MSFALLIIFMFVAFGLTTLFRKWIDIPTLIAVAIGCACNANYFTPISHPIIVGPFVFSFEIVLYTLFMYTILIRILDYGFNAAKVMTFTSIAAILISAFIELLASLAKDGFTAIVFKRFSYYFFSCIGTIVGVWLMIFITNRLSKRKVGFYIIIPLALAVSSIVHSAFYYGGISLVNWDLGFSFYPWEAILGALIGKSVCICLAVVCYLINKTIWIPSNVLKIKEGKGKD